MILVFDCPSCGRENEISIELENEFDYIEQDESKELVIVCAECENEVDLEMIVSVKERVNGFERNGLPRLALQGSQ